MSDKSPNLCDKCQSDIQFAGYTLLNVDNRLPAL